MNTNGVPHSDFIVYATIDWQGIWLAASLSLIGFAVYWFFNKKKSD